MSQKKRTNTDDAIVREYKRKHNKNKSELIEIDAKIAEAQKARVDAETEYRAKQKQLTATWAMLGLRKQELIKQIEEDTEIIGE